MYYTLENRTDKQVGSVFPQVSCLSQQFAHGIHFDQFASFDSEILFELQPKAKLTDVLSQAAISAHGLLVNAKVKNLLSGFTIMNHKYYKCLVKDLKGNTHDYYWLHLVDNFTDRINYLKSVFYWTKSTFRKDVIKLTSYQDYLELKKQNGILWGIDIDQISFDEKFNEKLDLFSCIPFDIRIYTSKKLKGALMDISGIKMQEALHFV